MFTNVKFVDSIVINWKIKHISVQRNFFWFNVAKFITYASIRKLRVKVNIFITSFKFIHFFSTYQWITIITRMKTHEKIYLCFTKINVNFFSSAPKFSLVPKLSPSPRIKRIIFKIASIRWWTIISPKYYNNSSKTSLKLHQPFPSNAIP